MSICKLCNVAKTRFYKANPKTPKQTKPGYKNCNLCLLEKPISYFHKTPTMTDGHYNNCKDCQVKNEKMLRRTLVGSLNGTLKSISKRIPNHQKQGKLGAYELSTEVLINLYERTRGRCQISGLILGWQPHSENRLSPERIDSRVTYTIENTVLVALRFNTSDNSHTKYAPRDSGSGQWNREKWIEFHRGYQHAFSPERDKKLHDMFDKDPNYVRVRGKTSTKR